MIKTVTTTTIFPRRFPAEKAIEILAESGFDSMDMGLDYWDYGPDSPFMQDGYLEWAKFLKEKAEAYGIMYTHSHAPGGADCGELIGRSIRTAGALGAKYMVLHPIYHDEEHRDIHDVDIFIRENTEAVMPWLELAEKCGIIILSENLQYGASADPRNLSALESAINSPCFGWCFDVGHAHCSGFELDVLRECANPPRSLHIHDNDGNGDDHLIPGDGTVDWNKFTNILTDIGYMGDCVMEAHYQHLEAPEKDRPFVLARLYEAADCLRNNINKTQKP